MRHRGGVGNRSAAGRQIAHVFRVILPPVSDKLGHMSDVTRLLDALRGRADFQKLFTEVEVTAEKAKP